MINEQMDIGDVLYKNRDQIELDYGPRTFKSLQSSLMLDDEAYVRNWLIKKGYLKQEEMPFEYRYSYKEEKIREESKINTLTNDIVKNIQQKRTTKSKLLKNLESLDKQVGEEAKGSVVDQLKANAVQDQITKSIEKKSSEILSGLVITLTSLAKDLVNQSFYKFFHYCDSGLPDCSFISSNIVLNSLFSVCKIAMFFSKSCTCISKPDISTPFALDNASILVCISPNFAKPPPIATTAAISAATEAKLFFNLSIT